MAAEGVVFFIFTILLQYKFFIRIRSVYICSLHIFTFFESQHIVLIYQSMVGGMTNYLPL